MSEKKIDWESFEKDALSKLKTGKSLEGKDGILAPLIKRLIEASIEGELDDHLSTSSPNRRNGKTTKKLKTGFGSIDLSTSRDRESSFEPELVKKRQVTLGESLDFKIISLYAKGMSYEEICEHLEELYGIEISPSKLTSITDRIIPEVHQWQTRPLDSVYPLVWLDAIHYKVREEGRIVSKAVYHVLGVDKEGYKDILGSYIGSSESAKFWLQVLSDLQSRGVKDIFIACIDNLSGFQEAIESVFPKTDVQLCVVHQIRNTYKYVVRKDKKELTEDMKTVYKALNIEEAECNLKLFTDKWKTKYPAVTRSWNKNWLGLSKFYQYPYEIRRIMYTNNIIESYHSQLRKITKSKRVFTNDKALYKLLYLVSTRITKKWDRPVANWKQAYMQLSIIFEDRIKN